MTTASDWAGAVGDVWAAEWRRTDRSFAHLSPHLNAAIIDAAPARGRAVDLGCGAGETSIALATARPDLLVTGVDLSPELVGVARVRAADLAPGLQFVAGDLAVDPRGYAAGANLLFSRHGVMFFADPPSVFAGLRAGVAPGATLVFSCFRQAALNPWASDLIGRVTRAAPAPPDGYSPGPFGFGEAAWVATMLADAGWTSPACEEIDYSYIAGEGTDPVGDAAGFFGRVGPVSAAIRNAPEADRDRLRDRLREGLGSYRHGNQVRFPAAAWLWSARAA